MLTVDGETVKAIKSYKDKHPETTLNDLLSLIISNHGERFAGQMDVHSFFVTLKHDPTKETYQGFAHRCEFACEITGQSKNLASGRFVHGVSPDDRIKLESARMGTTSYAH